MKILDLLGERVSKRSAQESRAQRISVAYLFFFNPATTFSPSPSPSPSPWEIASILSRSQLSGRNLVCDVRFMIFIFILGITDPIDLINFFIYSIYLDESPSGKLVQIEHALMAVGSGQTSLGIKGEF